MSRGHKESRMGPYACVDIVLGREPGYKCSHMERGDLELIQRACYAVRLDCRERNGIVEVNEGNGWRPFNPLRDRGDCFLLALRGCVSIDRREVSTGAVANKGHGPAVRTYDTSDAGVMRVIVECVVRAGDR